MATEIEGCGAPETARPAARRSLAARFYDCPPLLLVLATLFWGGNAIAGQLAVGHVSPMLLTLIRWVLVSTALWIFYGREAMTHFAAFRARWGLVAATAAIGYTGFNGLYYAASVTTSAINIGILQGAIPVFVLAGAYAMFGAPLGWMRAAGVAATLVGVAVVVTKGAPERLLETGLNAGDGLMLLACSCYAAYTLLLQRRPAIPGRALFTYMSTVAMIATIPLALIEVLNGASIAPSSLGWLLAVWIAIFPAYLAQLFFLRGVDLIGPGKAGVYINLVPVFAALLAVLTLGQSFELFHALGLALVLGGIWLSQRPQKGDKGGESAG